VSFFPCHAVRERPQTGQTVDGRVFMDETLVVSILASGSLYLASDSFNWSWLLTDLGKGLSHHHLFCNPQKL